LVSTFEFEPSVKNGWDRGGGRNTPLMPHTTLTHVWFVFKCSMTTSPVIVLLGQIYDGNIEDVNNGYVVSE
jgi:hypothetical protein